MHIFLGGLSEPTLETLTGMEDNVGLNLLNPAGYVIHQQFNIQQLYALPTMYLCV